MAIGDNIRIRLRDLDMSQAELARRSGLAQSTINGLINGASRSSSHLHRIARELGTSVAFLAGDAESEEEELGGVLMSGDERRLLQQLAQLGAAERKSVKTIVAALALAARSETTVHDKNEGYRAG